MARYTTRFSRKLHVAFATMLLITLSLAWYFYDSVKWYEYDMQRIALANNVLQQYQEISNLTFQELNALGDAVFRGDVTPINNGQSRDAKIRNAIFQVREGIEEKLAFKQDNDGDGDLEALADVERVVEEIIRTSGAINLALAEGRFDVASGELTRLRSTDVAGHFSKLIEEVLYEQRLAVEIADSDAIALAGYITKVLPIFMSILVVITLTVVFLFTNSLTRSVTALQDGAQAITSGNLGHRIPVLREKEFYYLGEALNAMAIELSESRSSMHDATVRLEAPVNERTRALQTSNEKLAGADKIRRKFLADISHEFRTPLTVIRGESEIALRGIYKSKAFYQESFQRIIDQVDNTTRLIDDLLFMARADAGEPRLKLRTVSLPGMIENVCKEFAAKAQQKGISIEQSCSYPKALVQGDEGRLRQLFAILMDNALRYSNPGGTVKVSLARVASRIQIQFQDDGIGLTKKDAVLAFERFHRSSKAEDHARGNGLGLPVAKTIVDAHKGKITLEGKPGKGATASVTLPVEKTLKAQAVA